MPFEIDQVTLIYLFAAVATILFVEALYLLFFSTASYKTTVNRRMRLMQTEPSRENILVQLRRERSLTAGGDYSLGIVDWAVEIRRRSGCGCRDRFWRPLVARLRSYSRAFGRGVLCACVSVLGAENDARPPP